MLSKAVGLFHRSAFGIDADLQVEVDQASVGFVRNTDDVAATGK